MKTTAEKFNKKYQVGTPVKYFPIRGRPDFIETTTRSEAWNLGHNEPVVMLTGKSGGHALSNIEIATQSAEESKV